MKHFDICGDISELHHYPNHFKIAIDNLVGTESGIRDRILGYIPIFDKVIVINCETPINILAQCEQFDLEKVELVSTGKINYEPKNMKIFRIENFFACVQMLYQRLPASLMDGLSPFTRKPYYFDALLGLEKPYRTWISDQIDIHCSDKVFKTYYKNRENLASQKSEYFSWTPGVDVIDTPNATSSTIKYMGQDTWISHVIPVEIYNQCAYSIISETYEDNTFSFFTEKTTKALMSKRLFVMFAGAYYLKNLRSLGFKTFGTIIDESYDLELDHQRRHEMAFEQVKYLCQQDQANILIEIESIVNHNHRLFNSHNWHGEYTKLVISRLNAI